MVPDICWPDWSPKAEPVVLRTVLSPMPELLCLVGPSSERTQQGGAVKRENPTFVTYMSHNEAMPLAAEP